MADERTLTAIYEISEDDILLLERFSVIDNKHARVAILRRQIAIALVPILFFFFILYCFLHHIFLVAIYVTLYMGLAVALVSCVIHLPGFKEYIQKELNKKIHQSVYKPILGKKQMTLSPEGVLVKTTSGESKVSWDNIANVTMLPNGAIFVFLATGNTWIVPRRAFPTDADRRTFFKLAEWYYHKAHKEAIAA